MSYNQFANSQNNFSRTQGGSFGMRNTQSNQFASQNPQQFNQSRIAINEAFLMSQNGGIQANRSQTQFNTGQTQGFRQNQRTPDNMQHTQFGNSSAQSGKQFQQPSNTAGYTQPFAVDGNRQLNTPSQMQMQGYQSPDASGQFQFGRTAGITQSNGFNFDPRATTNMGRTNQNMMGSTQQFGQEQVMNQMGFFGAQMSREINVETVRSNMATLIKDQGHRTANSFLREFDAYEKRNFETWELMSMFKLSAQQVRALLKQTDPEFHQSCQLRALCQELRLAQVQVDVAGFTGSTSEYDDRFNRSALQAEFKSLARLLLSSEFTPYGSNSYQEVYLQIKKFGKNSKDLEISVLKDFLDKKCGKILNLVQQGRFIDYLQFTRNNMCIKDVQFVHAMRQILPDQKRWDLNELLQYIQQVQPAQEKEKFVVDSHDPANLLIEKIRQHLYNKAIYNQIDSRFKSQLRLKLKLNNSKDIDLGEQTVAPMMDLTIFVESLQSELKLTQKEKEMLIARYFVTPQNLPPTEKPPNPPQNQADSSKPSQNLSVPSDALPKTASQQLIPPTSKDLSHAPSSESLARDSKEEIRQNIPVFNNAKAPINNQDPELMDEEIYEDVGDDFDSSRALDVPKDLKVSDDQFEGGQKEGIQKWFSLQKFKADMQPTKDMMDKNLTLARTFKFEVLQAMKGWLTLTAGSITDQFKLQDKKGTLLASLRQLKHVLTKIMAPKIVTDVHLNSVLGFFASVNDQGHVCIQYMQFYQFFFKYANLDAIQQNDPKFEFLREISDLTNQIDYLNQTTKADKIQKAYGKLFNVTDLQKRAKDKPIEVESGVLFQVMQKIKLRTGAQQRRGLELARFQHEKEIKELLKVQDGKFNLVFFQDLLGIKKEDEPQFAATNALRLLCSSLQLGGISIETIRHTLGKENQIQRFMNDLYVMLQSHGVFDGSIEQNNQLSDTIENLAMSVSLGSQINAARFVGKIEFEMHKLVTLQSFYIKLKSEMLASNIELGEVLCQHGADRQQREITRDDLLQMLKNINIIGEEDNGAFQYFIDEYDSDDNKLISFKSFEDDYEEFVGSQDSYLELLSQKMLGMIMMVCIQFHQSDLVATINTAFEAQPSQQIRNTYMQNYDFSRWFQVAIVESTYQNFDLDLIELFLQYTNACDKSKTKMVNIPNLLKKIAETHLEANTENLKMQLARLSIINLQNRIVEELQKRNQRPEQYFVGRFVSTNEFERMLTTGPFNLQTLELNSSIQEIGGLYNRGGKEIMLDQFVNDLNIVYQVQIQKNALFKLIFHSLEERGQDIRMALKMIKGSLNSQTAISLEEFFALVAMADVKNYDQQSVLKSIFEKFEIDSHGELNTDSFLADFEASTATKQKKQVTFQTTSKSILSSAGGKILEPSGKPIQARRNYKTLDESLQAIARDIEDRQLSDFGSFLKGYDFQHQNKIDSNDFFKVLNELFKDQVLGKGDILDFMKYLDPNQTGKIDIQFVANELNRIILNPNVRIVLASKVDEAIEYKIFDEIDETSRQKNIQEPSFIGVVILDLFCGMINRKQSMLSEWFAMFSRQEEGYLSLSEFTASLEKLDVSSTKGQKKAIFDYFLTIEKNIEREQDQKITGFVPTLLILQTINDVLPQSDIYSLVMEVISKICLNLHKTQIPLEESCARFELTPGSNEISYIDFTHGLLQKELQLEKYLTRNMIEVLSIQFNPNREQVFSMQPFINLIKQVAFDEGLKVFANQEEKDIFEQDQLNHSDSMAIMTRKVAPKSEPSFEVRSVKNTFFNGDKFKVILNDPNSHKLNDDIVIATRSRGLSVEKHFQGFGRFSPVDGFRRLDLRDFRDALSALNLEWAKKTEITSSLFLQIETSFSQQTLTLDMIGQIVYFNSNVNILQKEAQALEIVHKALYDQNILQNIEEIFNFHNFTKDGCLKSLDFQKILSVDLGLQAKLPTESIALLTQRYRIQFKDSQHHVFAFKFIEDLAYQHLNVGLTDQFASKIIEQMIKELQVKLVIEARRMPLQDSDAFDELKSFISRNCQTSRDEIFYDDLIRVLTYLKVINETEQKSKQQVDDFFKICNSPSVANIRMFQSNQFNADAVQLPVSVKLINFFNALQVLGRKPIICLYQDIFLQVYFSSKKRGISIHGPDLSNLFVQDDISQSGQVPLSIFIERLREKIISPQEVSQQDLLFLATKYMAQNRTSDQMINYSWLLNDYNEADTNQVSGKLQLIFSPQNQQIQREPQVKSTTVEQRTLVLHKTIDDLSEDQKSFFVKISKYLVSKDLDDILCIELVNQDQGREGFLPAISIKNSFKKIGIPVSQGQLQQLQSVLSTNQLGSYSYLEMISILFGLRYMQRIQSDNGLWSAIEKAQLEPKFDISKLQISQRLIDQLELRLVKINQLALEISKTKNLIKDSEVFNLFKKAEVELDSIEIETLQVYIRERRDQKTNLVNLTTLMKHFKVGEETSALLYQIQQQLIGKDINSLTSQRQLTFIDFRAMLQRAGVELPKQNETLEKLFKQISEQKQDVSRATLLRTLQNQTKAVESLQMPIAPPQVTELMQSLFDKKVDLKKELTAFIVTKRVPVTKFESTLAKYNLKVNAVVINFFKGTHGDLNLQQILAYFEYAFKQKSHVTFENQSKVSSQPSPGQVDQLPADVKVILERITLQLQKQRIDSSQLFKLLDSNGNGIVELKEFDAYCTKENLNEGLTKASIDRLFSYLDSTGDGSVSINELCLLIKGCQLKMEEKMAQAFSKEFEQELIQEIKLLFDRLDTDKNRWLTAQEIVIIFKNEGPSNSLSIEQAQQVIKQIDKDSNGRISKEEFVEYILGRQKQSLLEMEDKFQDLREVFSTLVNVKSGFGTQQHLTFETFKKFIQKLGLDKVTDSETQDLFSQIDINQSGTIDIDEIFKFITSNENLVGSTGTTLLQLRKKRAKLNQFDLVDFMRLLPSYLQPSFTQQFIEKQKEGRLSTSMMPNFDFSSFKFSDLQKVKQRTQLGNKAFITQHKPNFAMEFTVSEIKGVPNLAKQLILDESQTHLEVRYFLFDPTRHVFSSSVLVSHAKIAPQRQPTKGFVPSQQWCIDEQLKTICLSGSENWHLVIELVEYDQRDKSRQVTAGWTSCPLSSKAGKLRLPLRGGSPFNNSPPEILTQENEVKAKSGIAKLFGSNKAPTVERHVILEIKQFINLDEKLQADISMLPENTIFFKNLMDFIQSFRTHCHQKLLKCELLMQKPKSDLVLSQFSKIYDNPDLSAAVAEYWVKIARPGEDSVASMKTVVNRLYELINDQAFGFDHVYPTRSTAAENLKTRMQKLKECLLCEKSASPPQPQKTINAIVFTEDYQPFTMNELSLSLI